MIYWLALPFLLQPIAIAVDEFYFHRRRGLCGWERLSHCIDTFLMFACLYFVLSVSFTELRLLAFAALATLSCLLVTKDEFIHATTCSGGELWLHSLLFILHPVLLISAGAIWYWRADSLFPVLEATAFFAGTFLIYQLSIWGLQWHRRQEK